MNKRQHTNKPPYCVERALKKENSQILNFWKRANKQACKHEHTLAVHEQTQDSVKVVVITLHAGVSIRNCH